MRAPRKGGTKVSPNSSGANQHHERTLLDELPDLREILQGYVNDRVLQKDIPWMILRDHKVKIGLSTVQKYMKSLGVLTSRRNGLTSEDCTEAIGLLSLDDPLNRWGCRLVQEKLGSKSIHIPRDEIAKVRRQINPEASAARHPSTRKVHHHGIWSIGPNEEWCVDGHEKILNCMGIAVYGIIDKWSRMELGLWAMPNARVQALPPALYLRVVKECGGIPLTVTSDKGTEVGLLISFVTTMRAKYQPFLPEDQLPAFKSVKSVYNITRERAWRPVWEKALGNIAHLYKTGRVTAGFIESNHVHGVISCWVWGRIVQEKLDEVVKENQIHRIRKQNGILLPSGARCIDLYSEPERYGGKDRLIKVSADTLEELVSQYDRPDLLAFGTEAEVYHCTAIYAAIGSPRLSSKVGWEVFQAMVHHYLVNYRVG